MQLNIRITQTFLDQPEGVLSIHQLAKKLGLPYGTAYNRTHGLRELGVLQIQPQGKAKLCALHPTHPMTATLLGLGAAQELSELLRLPALSPWVQKIRDILEQHLADHLITAILLNKDGLLTLPWESLTDGSVPFPELESLPSPAGQAWETIDLFLITTAGNVPTTTLDTAFAAIFPISALSVTYMTVEPTTLIGMLQEKENDAGIAAYQMLRRGVILSGFDAFFRIVMKAFPRRLG